MKKAILRDLILSHYEGDNAAFFRATLSVLKELKEKGDIELEKDIELYVLAGVKIRPKPEPIIYEPEITFEDAQDLGLVPQESTDD